MSDLTLDEHVERTKRAAEAVREAQRPSDRRVRYLRFARVYAALGEATEAANGWLDAHWALCSEKREMLGIAACAAQDIADSDAWLRGLSRYENAQRALGALGKILADEGRER